MKDADDLFFEARTGRRYVVGGGGYAEVFQATAANGKLQRVQREPTAPQARTGWYQPDLNLLAVAAPHTAAAPARVLLFEVHP